jgi:uncharacterized MAPEG superfamily protein
MEYTALIIIIALAQYLLFTFRVGAARGKYGINAPSTTGDETFERIFRVQQNTMEQLIVFIPSMVLFSMYLSPGWALAPGIVFIIGRQLYSHEYVANPASRTPGVALSLVASAVLLIGGFVGVVLKLI